MSAHQFSDRPFAVGSLFGIRSFRVNADGALTGVVHQSKWDAGVNEAVCNGNRGSLANAGDSLAQMNWAFMKMSADMSGKVLLKKRPKPKPPEPMPEHAIGTLGCTCGYYAYFDRGHNPHHIQGNALGIIEGFGVMTVGSRGFRCSKARIRALICDLSTVGPVRPSAEYDGIPRFTSIEEALAEFPLTVPEGTPEPSIADMTGAVTVTLTFDTRAWEEAVAKLRRSLRYGISLPARGDSEKETPQERALRLRRERNTGPASRIGLDGHFRRSSDE